jgi:uncharacterized protein (TIGR02246 family)
MKAMRALSCIVAAALLTGCAAQSDRSASGVSPEGVVSPNAEVEIRALEQRWVDAETRRDAAAVAEILDDQFIFVFDSRAPIDKEQFIKAVPSFTSTSQVLSEQIVRIAGNTAVVTGRDTVEGPGRDGKPYKQNWRYTVTYVQRQGVWRALAEHMVLEQPSSP